MDITVSVIIPNYNHAPYLERRIHSILDQTYQNLEVIILDDCSTDNSCDILEMFRDNPKITSIVFNERNSGSAFRQWARGINLAKGDWIWIAESDDYCESNILEELVNNIHSCKNIVISYCQSKVVDNTGEVIGDMFSHTDDLNKDHWKTNYCRNGTDEIEQFLMYRNTIPNASAVLFNKAAYFNVSVDYQKLKLAGDWMLWIQLLKQGSIAYSSKPLNYFRTHSATTRVLDTYEKIKLRIEEEFRVLNSIKQSIPGISHSQFKKRLKDICRAYFFNTSKKELIKQLLGLKKRPIPFVVLFKNYFLVKRERFQRRDVGSFLMC
jgi:glycosyltransferase involved in cell wall biosynthesis